RGGRETDRGGEDRRARVAADRGPAPARWGVGERAAGEAGDPADAVAIPPIAPRAAAAPSAPSPSGADRNDGRSAVGTSAPRAESRLAAPIARTPGENQRLSSASALRRTSLEAEPARLDRRRPDDGNPQTDAAASFHREPDAPELVSLSCSRDLAVGPLNFH